MIPLIDAGRNAEWPFGPSHAAAADEESARPGAIAGAGAATTDRRRAQAVRDKVTDLSLSP